MNRQPPPPTARCVVIGGGGHARVLVDTLLSVGAVALAGILDSAPATVGKAMYGVPFLGDDSLLGSMRDRGVEHFVVGVGAVADNAPRRKIYELALEAGLTPLQVIHPAAIISQRATLAEGCQIFPGAVINADAKIGRNVIINTSSVVEHDCVVGDHAHIATGAVLASGVTVGAGAHVGAGAAVKQLVSIGDAAVVGAGAVVIRDVPPGVTVAGVPARPIAREEKAPNE